MSRVAQLSFDVALEDNEDSFKLLEEINDFIEKIRERAFWLWCK